MSGFLKQFLFIFIAITIFIAGILVIKANSGNLKMAAMPLSQQASSSRMMVGWWKFDEFSGQYAYDSSGRENTGTLGGTWATEPSDPSWVAGKNNSALSFDGSDYVLATDTQSLSQTNTISVCAWVKRVSTSGGGFITKGDASAGSSGYDYMLYFNGSNTEVAFFIKNSAGTAGNADSVGFNNRDLGWHHYTGIFDGDWLYIYVDGRLMGSANVSLTDIRDSANPLYIGRGFGTYQTAIIDDVRVYNYALSANQVRQVYEQGATGRYELNPILGHDLDLNATYYAQAVDNTIYDITTQDISMSAWVKVDTDSSGTMYILSKYFPGYALYLVNNAVDALIRDAEDTYQIYRSSGVEIRDNKWHHIAAVFDRDTAGNCRIFIDGLESGETIRTGTLANIGSISNEATLAIGRRSGSTSNYLDGQVRDVKLYYANNDYWTDSQILYQAQHPFDYSSNAGTLTDYWRCDEGSGLTLNGLVDNMTLSNELAWTTQSKTNISTGLVGYWKMDDNTATSTIIDYSGKNNTGVFYDSGSATSTSLHSTTTAMIGRAMVFDGVNDYIDSGNSSSLQLTSNFTVSAWFYKRANNNWESFVDKVDTMNSKGWSFGFFSDDNRIRVSFRKASSDYWAAFGSTVVSLNAWHYAVFYYPGDGTTPKVWLDGSQEAMTTWLSSGTALRGINDSGQAVDIGRGNMLTGTAKYFNGLIDDVRIYNYARTDEQIKQDYERGLKSLP